MSLERPKLENADNPIDVQSEINLSLDAKVNMLLELKNREITGTTDAGDLNEQIDDLLQLLADGINGFDVLGDLDAQINKLLETANSEGVPIGEDGKFPTEVKIVTPDDMRENEDGKYSDIISNSPDKPKSPDKYIYTDSSVQKEAKETSNSGDIRKIDCNNQKYEGKKHPITGVPFERKVIEVNGEKIEVVVPVFDSLYDVQLPENMYELSDGEQKKECNAQLKEAIENNAELRSKFTDEQIKMIESGRTPRGYTWHHDAKVGKMQLVDTKIHEKTSHTGGRNFWGGGTEKRVKKTEG